MKIQFDVKTLRQSVIAGIGITAAMVLGSCGGDVAFTFSNAAKDRYVRVDRTGQPAIATALLSRDPAITPLGPTGALLNPGNAANPINYPAASSGVLEKR